MRSFFVFACLFASLILAGCSSGERLVEAHGTTPDTSFTPVVVTEVAKSVVPISHPIIVDFSGYEERTIVIRTSERVLYVVIDSGRAVRFPIAVGKAGFEWSGEAVVGQMTVNPTWTPPPEMIGRRPELAKWAGGMPGGLSENPLGTRAIYLYTTDGVDTQYRIHGTNAPESIGTAASSGCIRMFNEQVELLYAHVRVGDKVIVED